MEFERWLTLGTVFSCSNVLFFCTTTVAAGAGNGLIGAEFMVAEFIVAEAFSTGAEVGLADTILAFLEPTL